MPYSTTQYVQLDANPIKASSTVREALVLMSAKDTRVLSVVDSLTGRALGIVLRQALERGCVKMGHDPDACIVAEHTLREVLESAAAPRRAGRRHATRAFRLLLDDGGFPLAILQYF